MRDNSVTKLTTFLELLCPEIHDAASIVSLCAPRSSLNWAFLLWKGLIETNFKIQRTKTQMSYKKLKLHCFVSNIFFVKHRIFVIRKSKVWKRIWYLFFNKKIYQNVIYFLLNTGFSSLNKARSKNKKYNYSIAYKIQENVK